MLEAGMKAPEFALPDQNGKVHTLEEYKGKKVILYFYPRDNTPGCTNRHVVSENYILNFQKRSGCAWSKQG